jgi:hypothetical protein
VLQIFLAIHLIVFELLKANTFTETQTCTHIHIQTRWKHNLIPMEVYNKQVCMQQIEIRNSLQFVGSITNDIEWKWVHALLWLLFRALILCSNAELTKVLYLFIYLNWQTHHFTSVTCPSANKTQDIKYFISPCMCLNWSTQHCV